ncbi:MAG TPA: YhjD/YihY/BrkB family envelope integrity protein [Stackebrandtia sp.]|uniref:YihY/virulence factor BrkB family protein n=1 Tax=Stackebrandtia sp. TaxID=2023065 RepID=UPI002D5424BB|nr:YhjD/YihY/BrkB family envelope integrity protein [Stackebrandtia sp.]HZE38958.1 YhjD/YihY/BrkB family envelope integrity protein [Stackebrandtia sp.]
MKFPDVEALLDRAVEWLRGKSKRFDHFWRAQERFFEVDAGRLSAAIAYYAFFAAFSLSLLAVAVLGYMLDFHTLYDAVDEWLRTNLPLVSVKSIRASASTIGLVALVALVITGVSWVQAIRSSIRAVWLLDQQPGHPILRWIIDLGVLIGLGVLLVGSIAITAVADVALQWLRHGETDGWLPTLINYGSTGIGLIVNTILAAALLSGLPRLALPLKRLLLPSLSVAIGLELLKTVGRLYINSAADRPAYQAVGTAVGLLIFLYLFNQMLLFASAWTATSQRGEAIDLAKRQKIETEDIETIDPIG